MSLQSVLEDYRNDKYKNTMPSPYDLQRYSANHVFDEDKSVKWNKEQVVLKNKERTDKREEYRKESNRLENQLREDISNAIAEEYGFNKEQADIILGYAYERHHSSGYYEVINSLGELCDVFESFKNAEK
ncbi:gp279 [Bacillus phage G]|uniref:Gp279 n=1 Tax=Bacillus phage G TaxID=2884420 RepID=G3MA20_9CAUD|nr:gp279 [Bacillus phage G]AEO93538.1 gp279 [Bacillus phage G]